MSEPIVIRLPFEAPPLRSNDRLHWAARGKATKQIRETAAWAGRQAIRDYAADFPIRTPVEVTLVWEVTNNRVRDVGAAAPTGKAAIDGLVDAGVLWRDRHSVVAAERYRIEVGASKGLRIEIRAVNSEQSHALPYETDAPARTRTPTEITQEATEAI